MINLPIPPPSLTYGAGECVPGKAVLNQKNEGQRASRGGNSWSFLPPLVIYPAWFLKEKCQIDFQFHYCNSTVCLSLGGECYSSKGGQWWLQWLSRKEDVFTETLGKTNLPDFINLLLCLQAQLCHFRHHIFTLIMSESSHLCLDNEGVIEI